MVKIDQNAYELYVNIYVGIKNGIRYSLKSFHKWPTYNVHNSKINKVFDSFQACVLLNWTSWTPNSGSKLWQHKSQYIFMKISENYLRLRDYVDV